ncbi:hypothetical protein MRX96_001244 [Rhipicephalus microplus]
MHLTLSTRSSKWTMYTSTAAFLLTLLMPAVLSDDYVVVSTAEGKVRGLRENVLGRDVDVFLGIPFAAPPRRRTAIPEASAGMFGFFDANHEGAPGNVGLWDQLMVMEWVQRNIRTFGGDPELVTLFGESSGSMAIHLHLMSPFSAGLFHRAFFMSGTESTDMDIDSIAESIQTDAMVSVVENEGVFAFVMQPDKKLLQDDLSGYDWEEFIPAIIAVLGEFVKSSIFPVGLQYLENSRVTDKAAFRQEAADFVGKCHFYCSSRVFVENYSARNGQVYGMVFSHRSQKSTLPKWTKVIHMQEIPYFFGIPLLDFVNYDEEDRQVSAEAMRMLASFAQNGKPTAPNGTRWTPFSD